jgi:hypothetical protein
MNRPKNADAHLYETIELSIYKPKEVSAKVKNKNIRKYKMNNFKIKTELYDNYLLYSLCNGTEIIPINYYYLNDLIHIENDDKSFISLLDKRNKTDAQIITELKKMFSII